MQYDASVDAKYNARFIETAAGWYALVRENSDLGPFVSRYEAEQALERHLRIFQGINDRPLNAFQGIAVHDSAHCRKTNCGLCIEARQLDHGLLKVG